VLSSTGQTAPETITRTFIELLTPTTSIRTGTRTGGGIARKNSNNGSVKRRNHLTRPMGTPSAIPSAIAIPVPTAKRATLGSTSEPSRSPNHVSRNVAHSSSGVVT
jgi:hypothetical protein